jgi:uncharacterized membrane protein YbhN (UPF0104 family)
MTSPSPEQGTPAAPGPSGGTHDAASASERGRLARIVRNKRFVKLVAAIIMVALLYYAFFVVLPQEINWDDVASAVSALSAQQLVALGVSGLIVMCFLGWASKASLPGLTLYQGFESSGTSQMTAFVVPPPGDYVIRFSMYRTYGFTDQQSGISVLIAMVLRYVAIFAMPVIGFAAALLAGVAPSDGLLWFLGLSVGLVLVVVLLRRVVRSDAAAHAVGRWISGVVTRVMRWFHRTPAKDLEASVVEFGRSTRGTVDQNRRSLVASNLGWGLSNILVLGLAIRFSGLDAATVPFAAICLATGVMMVVNILPIPGKSALIAPTMFTLLSLTTTADQSALTAALLLYRVVTWIEPMLIGCILFFLWRYRVRKDTVTTVNRDADEDEPEPLPPATGQTDPAGGPVSGTQPDGSAPPPPA